MMSLLKVKSERKKTGGILYLLYFELEGVPLVKIGVTARTIEDRTSEILVAMFKKYREFPYCKPKRFKKVDDVYCKEALLHKYFKECKYVTKYKFGGSTEFFDVPLNEVVRVYEELLDGKDIMEGR